MLQAGFAATCITPPLGKEIPGLFEQRFAIGIHDDLYARAAVVDDGKKTVALVQTDTIGLPETVVTAARKRAASLCGIRKEACFIAATHTHSGGPVMDAFLSKSDPDYLEFLAVQIASAIAEAHRLRRPAIVGSGASDASGVAYNRRFHMRDGKDRTHPGKMNPDIIEPAGPADPSVTVVGFADPVTCRPFGCIINFACHATHMNGLLYSADYPKWLVDTVRAVYGSECGVVYLNGACGDVTQVDNRSPRPPEFGPYWAERTGRTVGAAAVQAFARMDYVKSASVDSAVERVSAALRQPSASDLRAARGLLAKHVITAENVETIYAREMIEVDRIRRRRPRHSLEIMGIRVADTLFWGVPGEFFQEFALEVKSCSPLRLTCCVELANGCFGYICTHAAFAGGGYEIRTARSSMLEPNTGPRVVNTAKRLCIALHKNAERELRALADRRVWPGGDDSALDGINQLGKKKKR